MRADLLRARLLTLCRSMRAAPADVAALLRDVADELERQSAPAKNVAPRDIFDESD